MSLYNFFESFINTNPDLTKINYETPIQYDELYWYYLSKEKRFPIQTFLDGLFYDYLTKHAQSLEEYQTLQHKTLKISQVSQKLLNLQILNDKLEKESSEYLIEQNLK